MGRGCWPRSTSSTPPARRPAPPPDDRRRRRARRRSCRAPVVSGPARVGETLAALAAVDRRPRRRADRSHWRGSAAATPTSATCTVAAGAGATHLIAESERGLRLRVRAAATGAGGALVTWSAPTEPVLGRNECLLVAPGTITACVGASSRVTLEASLDRARAVSGQAVVVRGRITVAGDVARPDRVTVVHGGRAQLAAVDAGGGVRADVRARAVGARHGDRDTWPGAARRWRSTPARCASCRGSRAVHRPARPWRHGARPAGHRPRAAARARVAVPAAARGPHAEGPRRRPDLPRRRAAGRARGPLRRATAGRAACRGSPATGVRFLPGPGSPLEAAQTGWQRAALAVAPAAGAPGPGPLRCSAAPRSL